LKKEISSLPDIGKSLSSAQGIRCRRNFFGRKGTTGIQEDEGNHQAIHTGTIYIQGQTDNHVAYESTGKEISFLFDHCPKKPKQHCRKKKKPNKPSLNKYLDKNIMGNMVSVIGKVGYLAEGVISIAE
jgi:hypothetical protein